MKCPICNAEMESGKLYGDRYELKWLPSSKKLALGIWAKDADKVDSRTRGQHFTSRPFVIGNKCKVCQKIILDVLEKEK